APLLSEEKSPICSFGGPNAGGPSSVAAYSRAPFENEKPLAVGFGPQATAGSPSVVNCVAGNASRICCVQLEPPFVVMYTPIVSTVGLNGQLEDPPVAGVQSGSWISSFAPAAAIAELIGLTATIDSFCLFCGKCAAAGLTRCSVAVAPEAADVPINAAAVTVAAAATTPSFRLMCPPH